MKNFTIILSGVAILAIAFFFIMGKEKGSDEKSVAQAEKRAIEEKITSEEEKSPLAMNRVERHEQRAVVQDNESANKSAKKDGKNSDEKEKIEEKSETTIHSYKWKNFSQQVKSVKKKSKEDKKNKEKTKEDKMKKGEEKDDFVVDENNQKNDSQKNNQSEEEKDRGSKHSFFDDFSQDYTLEETGKMSDSENENWWVNSGAFLYAQDGTGRTIFGDLPKDNPWLKKYKDYNAKETDNGRHPQNIFRLVLRPKWKNFQQECYYNIHKYILSNAKERSESNGILLFNRYLDGYNLYYTGLRVDGTVVVKKKYKGKYYTMVQKAFYPGKYHKKRNPNLIPLDKWIGIRSEVETLPKNQVLIKVFVDENHNGQWRKVIEVKDDGKKFGGGAILEAGHAGIRTDFMDVKFDDYKISEL